MTMTRQFVVRFVGIIFIAVVIFGLALFVGGRLRRDGIEAGKIYGLAMTYEATDKGQPVRVFDFKDRNLPRASVMVPVADGRGMPLVRENTNLPSSSVRKVVGNVPTQVVEGVTYFGYPYTLWEYHMRVKEPQSVVPEIIPSR